MKDVSSRFLNRTQLIQLKSKAMRSGVWFKALARIDRVLVDLTIRVTETVRSASLAKGIFTVLCKLEGLLTSRLESLKLAGRPIAVALSSIAQKWGNLSAKSWETDSNFAIFLTIIHTNRLTQ